MIELRPYQLKAVCGLQEKIYTILRSDPNVCVFKSPTGSGKTVCVAELIRQLSEDNKVPISYLWISVHNLHRQSKVKLENHYQDSHIVNCSEFDDLQDSTIEKNEILFFNWESINKKDNIYIRDNERDHNLSSVIANTKEQGHKIVLIIDESHHTAEGPKSKELIAKIAPDVTLEVSATPQIPNVDQIESVQLIDVIESGMIKKETAINQSIDKLQVTGQSEDELVIAAALVKREALLSEYKRLQRPVNPLILIQLPDARGSTDKKDDVERILHEKFGINTKNGKLAIHLSDKESKVNLANIEKNDNSVQVLIFKQALALGWDCPRASILVLFREWKKIEFSIQTVGRIMRTPEHMHYDSDMLNAAYVYSNVSQLKIARDISKDFFTVYESRLNESIYTPVKLSSSYIKRRHEKTRLNAQFSKILHKVPGAADITKTITQDTEDIINEIMIDGIIHRLDKGIVIDSGKKLGIEISDKDLDARFVQYSKTMSSPYAMVHSSQMLRTALYKICENNLNITDYTQAQRIILAKENNEKFTQLIIAAKEQYGKDIVAKITKDEVEAYTWQVPKEIMYSTDHIKHDFEKSVLAPVYVKKEYTPEMQFMQYLNDSRQVKWWFKNGVRDKKYFALLYNDDNLKKHPFYVDFVVCLNNGTIGLFDPKEGFTIDETKAKGLANYIKGKDNIFGGLVVLQDNVWRYSDAANFNDLNTWKKLDLS